jgi:ComF family protein
LNLCLLCGATCPWSEGLCPPCRSDCARCGPACRRCGIPLPGAGVCGACLANPPPFDGVVAPFLYRYPVDALIRDLKFHDRLACVRFLGGALADEVRARRADPPERLVPVPLHWRRRIARGFNQSLEIARVVGVRLNIPIDRGTVARVRATPAQAGLPATERRRNLRGAFRVVKEPPWKRVAIVDDVMTTGATAREISRVLKRAGVEELQVWAVARAGDDFRYRGSRP